MMQRQVYQQTLALYQQRQQLQQQWITSLYQITHIEHDIKCGLMFLSACQENINMHHHAFIALGTLCFKSHVPSPFIDACMAALRSNDVTKQHASLDALSLYGRAEQLQLDALYLSHPQICWQLWQNFNIKKDKQWIKQQFIKGDALLKTAIARYLFWTGQKINLQDYFANSHDAVMGWLALLFYQDDPKWVVEGIVNRLQQHGFFNHQSSELFECLAIIADKAFFRWVGAFAKRYADQGLCLLGLLGSVDFFKAALHPQWMNSPQLATGFYCLCGEAIPSINKVKAINHDGYAGPVVIDITSAQKMLDAFNHSQRILLGKPLSPQWAQTKSQQVTGKITRLMHFYRGIGDV